MPCTDTGVLELEIVSGKVGFAWERPHQQTRQTESLGVRNVPAWIFLVEKCIVLIIHEDRIRSFGLDHNKQSGLIHIGLI